MSWNQTKPNISFCGIFSKRKKTACPLCIFLLAISKIVKCLQKKKKKKKNTENK